VTDRGALDLITQLRLIAYSARKEVVWSAHFEGVCELGGGTYLLEHRGGSGYATDPPSRAAGGGLTLQPLTGGQLPRLPIPLPAVI
jgi:hypothetical protein